MWARAVRFSQPTRTRLWIPKTILVGSWCHVIQVITFYQDYDDILKAFSTQGTISDEGFTSHLGSQDTIFTRIIILITIRKYEIYTKYRVLGDPSWSPLWACRWLSTIFIWLAAWPSSSTRMSLDLHIYRTPTMCQWILVSELIWLLMLWQDINKRRSIAQAWNHRDWKAQLLRV